MNSTKSAWRAWANRIARPAANPIVKTAGALLAVGVPLWFYRRILMEPFLLAVPMPQSIRAAIPEGFALAARYEFTRTALLLLVIFTLVFALRGWWGTLFGLGAALAVFALPLAAMWQSGYTDSAILKGLLPVSDAQGYYMDALRLLEGMQFSLFSSRRPLFASLLSVIMLATGRSLALTLMVLTAITAAACYLAAREIQRTHGLLAGVIVMVITFFFFRRFIGTTLTENLGLALGALAFALLWRGTSHRRPAVLLFGMFTATMAMNARSGAYFVLPLLALWAGYLLRGDRKYAFKTAGLAMLVIAVGFGFNSLLCKAVCSPNAISNGNFSTTLYGLTTGGTSWTQVYTDYPDLAALDPTEQFQKIYQISFEEIRHNPAGLARGIFKAWRQFFELKLGAYSFIRSSHDQAAVRFSRLALTILVGVFAVRWAVRRKDDHNTLLMVILAGIILSIPFTPPWDNDYMRVHAVVIPWLAAIPALGLLHLIERVRLLSVLYAPVENPGASAAAWSAAGLLAVTLLVPPVIIGLAKTPQPAAVDCPAGMTSLRVKVNAGSYLKVFADSHLSQTWIPDARYDTILHGGIYDYTDSAYLEELAAVLDPNPATLLVPTIDIASGAQADLIARHDRIPVENEALDVCGQWSESGRFFIVNQAHGAAPQQ